MLVEHLARHVPFPEYDVPEIRARTYEDVEEAAACCRRHWGLGSGPISSMVRVLENAGVVVTRLSGDTKKVDAFSRAGRTRLVVLNTFKGSATRSRFDCGHELGHLVMHNGVITGDETTERQADRFAGAFLLPAESFVEDFRSIMRPWNWAGIFELKRSFSVSAPAIVRRAFDLDLIGPSQYRRSYKYMSAKGWLHGKVPEPYEPQPEQPELLHAALCWLEDNRGESPLEVARALGWSPALFQRITGADVSEHERLANVASIDKWRKRRQD